MGTTKQIAREDWKTYFERFTRQHLSDELAPGSASVEVVSPLFGDQFEARALRLLGLTYDQKSRAFEVLLEDLDHLISYPTEIWVVEGEDGFIHTIELVHPDGTRELVHVHRGGPPAPRFQDLPTP